MGMLQRKDFLRISAMAMHCRAQEFRCWTNVMLMSPARRVNLTARSSAKVQPLPPQPLLMAFFRSVVTFLRSVLFFFFIVLGWSCVFLVTLKSFRSLVFLVFTPT